MDIDIKEYESLDKELMRIAGEGLYQGITKNNNNGNNIVFYPTNCIALDRAIKGLAQGRIYEIFGPQGSGKSSLCLYLVSAMQSLNKVGMWIDIEGVFTPEYASACGVDMTKLITMSPNNMNEALEAIRIGTNSGLIDIIVVDSVAAMVPKDEYDKDIGGGMIGTRARLMSSTLPQIVTYAKKTGTIILFINQERAANMTTPGPKSTTTGGNALPYYASVRLDLNRVEWIDNGADKVGMKVCAKSIKNKTYTPFKSAIFTIMFMQEVIGDDDDDIRYVGGLDLQADLITNGIELGILERKGSWLQYKDRKIQGEQKFRAAIIEEPELAQAVKDDIWRKINNNG